MAMMTTLQKQQTKQEQLAQEHKADLENLHKADLEKVVRVHQERQEDLATDQETKWLQFMEKQDKRGLEIEQNGRKYCPSSLA